MSRLYVLTRKDLPNSQSAVQAGHAVAKWLLHDQTTWTNEYLIYLGVNNEQDLKRWGNKLTRKNIKWVGFREPDLNDELTSIATTCNKKVKPLNEDTYCPGGWTALYDAVGVGIDATLERRKSIPEEERAANIVFAILTDGEENKSEEYKDEAGRITIFDKIDKQKNQGWEFVFLGANQDAINSGKSLGIAKDRTMSYNNTCVGSRQVYACNLSKAVSSVRKHGQLNDENWKNSD